MIGIGIAGSGFGGTVHLPAFLGIPGVEVRGIADAGSGRSLYYSAELPYARVFSNAQELACDDRIDLLVVAVPPLEQGSLVRKALRFGKTVLCEKPLGASLAQTISIAEAAHSVGGVTAVNLLFRYDPGLRALKRAIDESMAGELLRIDVAWFTSGAARPERPWSWRNELFLGGGIIADFAVHVLDYLSWLTAQKISAISGNVIRRMPCRRDGSGVMREVSAEDECDLSLILGDKLVAHIAVSNTYPIPFGHRIEVFGSKGRLLLHHFPPFSSSDRRLTFSIGGESSELPVCDTEPAGQDCRILATRRLALDLIAAREGVDVPNLPTFDTAVELARVVHKTATLRRFATGGS